MRIPLGASGAIGECEIRSWQSGDEAALLKYANNREIWINLRDVFPHPYTEKDAKEWIQIATHQNPETQFAIASASEAVGGIGFRLEMDVHRRCAEIGYWLGEPFWGKGIMTKAVRAVTDYAFSNFDLVRIHTGVFEWNQASFRVLEKAGYEFEGVARKSVFKDGRLIDQRLYARVRES